MGKIRRGGYVLEWFVGDHQPRHVHVYDTKGSTLVGSTLTGLWAWKTGRRTGNWLSSSKP